MKKKRNRLAVLLTAASMVSCMMAGTAGSTVSGEETELTWDESAADVNGDGRIDFDDVSRMLDMFALLPYEKEASGDVNSDGWTDMADAVALTQWIDSGDVNLESNPDIRQVRSDVIISAEQADTEPDSPLIVRVRVETNSPEIWGVSGILTMNLVRPDLAGFEVVSMENLTTENTFLYAQNPGDPECVFAAVKSPTLADTDFVVEYEYTLAPIKALGTQTLFLNFEGHHLTNAAGDTPSVNVQPIEVEYIGTEPEVTTTAEPDPNATTTTTILTGTDEPETTTEYETTYGGWDPEITTVYETTYGGEPETTTEYETTYGGWDPEITTEYETTYGGAYETTTDTLPATTITTTATYTTTSTYTTTYTYTTETATTPLLTSTAPTTNLTESSETTTDMIEDATTTTETTDVIEDATTTTTETTDVIEDATTTTTETTDVIEDITTTTTETTDVIEDITTTTAETTDMIEDITTTTTETSDVIEDATTTTTETNATDTATVTTTAETAVSEEETLPQTGRNALNSLLAVCGAAALTAAGAWAVQHSGVLRKRED